MVVAVGSLCGCGPKVVLLDEDSTTSAGPDDGGGDPARARLFAEAEDQVGQLPLGQLVDQLGGRDAPRRIEAHVERPVEAKGKAALGDVELER